MHKIYRYRMYPNKKQQVLIQKTFGCCRFVYNYYLDKRNKYYQEGNGLMTSSMCSKDLTNLKNKYEWLKEPDKDALQKSLRDLDHAYRRFFANQSNFPKFKSKKEHHKSYSTSCTYNNIRYSDGRIKLPKLGWIKVRSKQSPEGRILHASIIQDRDGKYYVDLCCTDIVIEPFPKTNKYIGIDLGIENFAIYSDGTKINNPRFYEQSEKKLIRLQKELERRKVGSANWEKTRIKIAKLHKKISSQRKDYLQKLTTNIIKDYDVICIENLSVQDMLSNKLETNSLMHARNKHINDVSWGEFRKQLMYKCEWYDKELRLIDSFYPSSQICSCCGKRDKIKTVNIRKWICPNCGAVLDRDVNAAINILNEGLKLS